MKLSRLVIGAAIALGCIAATPAPGSAQDPYWDWCVKIGDYYDTGGTGYHVIYCEGEYSGSAFYYIRHGTPFKIERAW
jgi:hypothetical protein